MGTSYAKVEVRCEEMGFSRTTEIPLDGHGYIHQLVEDLEKALELYTLRIENKKLKQMPVASPGPKDGEG